MNKERKIQIQQILHEYKDKELIFVHTPKCGGTYVISILNDLNIKNIGHNRAEKDGNLYFTVIREPVERFESLLNFRLQKEKPYPDWPTSLLYVFENKNETYNLNYLFEQMTDKEIVSFTPFCNLVYWSTNVQICITLQELKDFLQLLNMNYDEEKYIPLNVSNKVSGKLTEINKLRIKIFSKKTVFFMINVLI